MLHIGKHAIKSPVLLAPMAGITDVPFRELCFKFGAGLTTSEMLTSDASLWHTQKSISRLKHANDNSIKSIQIAGHDPHIMAEAAKRCEEMGADIIDINMGCPVKKVCKKLAGSALLQDEQKVQAILETVVNAVTIPVTLKTRTGWSCENKNGHSVAKIAEQAGIQALAVHGRTRECKFNGNAEYDTIANIVSNISIPVFANGDITTVEKARQVLSHTGAQAVMVGRGAFGNPWLIQAISRALTNQKTRNESDIFPTASEAQETMEQHIKAIHAFYGETQGVRISRKHMSWYAKTLAQFNLGDFNLRYFHSLTAPQQQLKALNNFFKEHNNHKEQAA